MNTVNTPIPSHQPYSRQKGLVLFFALIALVVMSLAAVALIRSVDTNTMIAGNLSFRQGTTSSGDFGTERAIAWLAATDQANNALNIYTNPAHPFNITNAAAGYYSSFDPNMDLFQSAPWNAITAIPAQIDPSGNQVQYIIQRMCRNANTVVSLDNCLFSGAIQDKDNKTVKLLQEICDGPGCPSAGQSPELRITARSTGPKNTVSYIQAFVF